MSRFNSPIPSPGNSRRVHEDATLRRLNRLKRADGPVHGELGPDFVEFFKQIERRHKRLGKVGDVWRQLIPELLQEHCCVESFNRGTMTVVVDSSPHLYDLKQLLLAGLEQQILLACRGEGLRKITLKSGRWYEGTGADRKVRFS